MSNGDIHFMKNQEQAFLEAILECPDDDTPRLIFADWLEERGDAKAVARAEFIRVQCALAGGQLTSPRRIEFERRAQQILDEWGELWVRPIRRLVQSWAFHRGFIDEVVVWDDRFLAVADRLFCRAPIQHVKLRPHYISISRPIAAMTDSEHLRRLRSLDLSKNYLESRHVRALVVSEHLTRLTDLDLSRNRIGDGGIRALAGSPLLSRLERLSLGGNEVGAGGLRVLTKALEELAYGSEGLRLQRLELSPVLSNAAQRVIAESSLLRRIVRC